MNTTKEDVPKIEGIVEGFLKLHYEPEHISEKTYDDEGNREKCWCEPVTEPLIEIGSWLGRFEIKHHEQREILAEYLRTILTSLQAELEARVEGKRLPRYKKGAFIEHRNSTNAIYNKALDDTKAIISSAFK